MSSITIAINEKEEGEEKMLGADIEFSRGISGSDCQAPYYIKLKREFTVKEFVERVLNATQEWGSIKIKTTTAAGSIREIAQAEYRYGDIIEESQNFADYYNYKIESVSGHGGWSLSNFYIEVKA